MCIHLIICSYVKRNKMIQIKIEDSDTILTCLKTKVMQRYAYVDQSFQLGVYILHQ